MPEPVPSASRLLLDALIDHARQIARLPELVFRTLRNVWTLVRHRRNAPTSTPSPILGSPKTLFNTPLTSRRIFATGVLSLNELKTVKTTFGVTFNDVVLALMAGSVRSYLERRGALPERSLTVEVPIATDTGTGEPRLAGNRLSSLVASLCTNVKDPVERLRTIHEVIGAAKEHHDLLGSNLMQDWLQYVPPRPFAWVMRNYAQKIAERFSPAFSVIASSVPGPRKKLYWRRTRLIDLYSVGPILEGVGLNVTMWSYGDRVYVGAIACPDRLPDLNEIIEGIHASLADLLDAAGQEVPFPCAAEAPT
jgi:diacylglycerol O-acyltransferase